MKFFTLKPKPEDNPIIEYQDWVLDRVRIGYAIIIIAFFIFEILNAILGK